MSSFWFLRNLCFLLYRDPTLITVCSHVWHKDILGCLVCDLLILDDLGCEMTTRFVTKVLYDIVNGRLEQGKHTVMSTNLSTADIGQRYSPAIASRISGGYMPLLFFGDDIRTLKSGYGYAAAASGM